MFLPAYRGSVNDPIWFGDSSGRGFSGMAVFLVSFFVPGWYANIGLIFKKPVLSLISGIANAFLSLSAIGIDSYAGPTPSDLAGVGGGFYLWFIAVNIPLALRLIRHASEPPSTQKADSQVDLPDDNSAEA